MGVLDRQVAVGGRDVDAPRAQRFAVLGDPHLGGRSAVEDRREQVRDDAGQRIDAPGGGSDAEHARWSVAAPSRAVHAAAP
jgi:hypothetical protein